VKAIAFASLATAIVSCADARPRPPQPSPKPATSSVSTSPTTSAAPATTTKPLENKPIASVASTSAPSATTTNADDEAYNGPWPPPLDAPCGSPSNAALDAARAHFVEGLRALDDDDALRAIVEFQQAYRLVCHGHSCLYNVARAEEEAGRIADAIANYTLYLQRAQPDPDRAAETAAHIDELKKSLKKKP
jgi:hypothetical protein